MPSSLYVSPAIDDDIAARVCTWLELEQSVPSDQAYPEQRKRQRDSDSDSDPELNHEQDVRRGSPKRWKGDDDEVLPGQSMSQAGSDFELNDRTTSGSLSSGSKRPASAIRQSMQLRFARPPILQYSLIHPSLRVPAGVAPRLHALRERLGRCLTSRFIPACLRSVLETEPVFQNALSDEPIDDDAYDESDERSATQCGAIVDRVKAVLQGTQLCTKHNMDKNAWIIDVVIPLLDLALILHGRGNFQYASVQSQSIQPAYLPRVVDPSSNNEKYIFRKTDFCFYYSHLHSKYAALYKRLRNATISHTTDVFTEAAALFSGIEIKPPDGDAVEAQVQVSIWMAASLRKKAEMARCAMSTKCNITSLNEAIDVASPSDCLPDLSVLIEPGVTIIGHEHKIYYAFFSTPIVSDDPDSGAVSVLGPDRRLPLLTTQSVQGIFQLATLYGNILEYGMDEGKDGFWGAFLGPVLESIACARQRVWEGT